MASLWSMLALRNLHFMLVGLLIATSSGATPGRHVAVVVLSGLSSDQVPEKAAESGARATIRSVFPAESFPNRYSIVTGLEPLAHGVVGNRMLDEATDEVLDAAKPLDKLLASGELIWTTAQKQNVQTATFTSGSNSPGGLLQSPCPACKPEELVGRMVSWISSIIEGDSDASTLSFLTLAATVGEKFSDITEKVLQDFKDHSLDNQVDVIFTGDHGLVSSQERKTICLPAILKGKHFEVIDHSGGMVSLRPVGNETEADLWDTLRREKGFTTYLRDDFAHKFHLVGSHRVAPVTVVVQGESHVLAVERCNGVDDAAVASSLSRSGYSSQAALSTLFVGVGPGFPRGRHGSPINITDVYQIICALLDLQHGQCKASLSDPVMALLTSHTGVSGDELVPAETGHRHVSGVGVFFIVIAGFGFLGGLYWMKNFFSDRRQRTGYKRANQMEPDLTLRTQPLLAGGDGDEFAGDSFQLSVLGDSTLFQVSENDEDDDAPPRMFTAY